MTPWALLGGIGLVVAVACGVVRGRLVRECGYRRAAALFRAANADQRRQALRTLLQDPCAKAPAWYLVGCLHLRTGDVREAARAFGMAYHGDDRLESAALLTFTCLKAGNDGAASLLTHALTTWKEMKAPDLPRTAEDRMLLACLEQAEAAAPSHSPLAPPPARLIRAILGATGSAILSATGSAVLGPTDSAGLGATGPDAASGLPVATV